MKRTIAFLMVICMLLVSMPSSVFAVEPEAEDIYIQVSTIEELYAVRNDLTANYILMNDIDLTAATAEGGDWDYGGRGWNPIGSGDLYKGGAFSGVFDGNGHTIKGLRINLTTSNYPAGVATDTYAGLFANVTGTVRNLHLADVDITATYYSSTYSTNAHKVGAIAGAAGSTAVIENCSVTGEVTTSTSSDSVYTHHAGGLIGVNGGTVECCYNEATVTGYYAGGIAGYHSGTIEGCYNIATISGGGYGGGIAGRCTGSVINDCYNSGNIYGKNAGGIAAYLSGASSSYSTIMNCYNVGAIKYSATSSAMEYGIAYLTSYCTITNGYYLDTTGQGSTGATALTEAQMRLQQMFAGFDFETVWQLNPSAVYPYPQLQSNLQNTNILKSVTLSALPDQLSYTKGENFKVNGAQITVEYEDAEPEVIPVTKAMVTGYDASVVGEQTLTVAYTKCLQTYTFTFTVTVNDHAYQEIRTIAELYAVRDNLSGNYILMNDIDLTDATAVGGDWDYGGRGWNPVGSQDNYSGGAFSGVFDGNGHTIKGLRINLTNNNPPAGIAQDTYAGLFANVTGTVRNLHLADVDITATYHSSTYSTNDHKVGAIAGVAGSTAVIENCSVTGEVTTSKSSEGAYTHYAGGLIGVNGGTVECCYNEATVTGYYAGGIAGYHSGAIEGCYNIATISGGVYGGGIAGRCTGSVINDCYNSGNIYGNNAGGIAAYLYNTSSKIINCYNVGLVRVSETSSTMEYGVAYISSGTITNSYYLDGTGRGSTGSTSLTEAQMHMQQLYTGFDFENVWTICADSPYPYPQLQSNLQDGRVVKSLAISAAPDKTTYFKGESLDLTGAKVTVEYENAATETFDITADMVSGFDAQVVGEQTITVTYYGKAATFTVVVNAAPIIKLTLESAPTKTSYVEGQVFDPTGMKVVATYETGETAEIDDYEISGFVSTPGLKTIIVSCGDKRVSFTVNVIAKTLEALELVSLPAKVQYLQNETFDPTGLEVQAVYNDGSAQIVTDYQMVGYSSNPGTHTVAVIYQGMIVTFDVTVLACEMTGLTITAPSKMVYYVGDELDTTGLIVTAHYNNGQQSNIQDYTLSGFDSTTTGVKVITVSYGGFSKTFSIFVTQQVEVQTKGEFVVDNVTARLGEEVRVPVTVSDNVGVAGMRHIVGFDATDLKFVSLEMQGEFANGTAIVNDEKAAEGKLALVWFSNTDIKANGVVYELVFEVLETAEEGLTDVTLEFTADDNGNISGENVLFGKQDGSVDVLTWWLGDLNGDRKYAMVDLVMLAQYVADFDITLTENQLLAADVNQDGTVNIHDVILLNQWLLAEEF